MSMCLERSERTGLRARLMAAVLSAYILVGMVMPNSWSPVPYQSACRAALAIDMYSDSIVDVATDFWRVEDQEMQEPSRKKQWPDQDRCVSLQLPYEASEYTVSRVVVRRG